ncbi:MAG TPA: phosphoesterase [Arcobacter sp.]|nr:phosphoesterase [Arcobacter sp.]HIP56235.1 phosphoesterase [Arcobacter sp.]
MKFFHISHTDLDGYGCQLISKKIFPDGKYYNANYGLEVKANIKTVLSQIEKLQNEEVFFLISDLNLTSDESKSLNKNINNLNDNGYNIKLQLLDHHATGKPSADKHDWYFLDTSRCATKIVFDYFCENYDEFLPSCSEGFKTLVEAIDDVDIWHDEDAYFEFGKVAMRLIAQANEINPTLFPNQNRQYRLSMLEKAIDFIEKENGHIEFDDAIHHIKKDSLKLNDTNDTLDNLSAKHLVHLLEDRKEELSIYHKGQKGILTFTLMNISIPANAFLKANPDFDFFINVGRRGSVAFRADGKIDMSKIAQAIAGGGGHPNASGGSFKGWKETIDYSVVKNFIEEKLDNI